MAKKDFRASAQAATAKLFSQPSEGSAEAVEAVTKGNTSTRSKAPEKAQKAEKKPVKVFSFRADEGKVAGWRLYAVCHGIKVDELGAAAMEEYIKRHALKGAEKDLFDQRIQENMNS